MKNLPAVSWALLLSIQSHWVLSWHNNNTSHVAPLMLSAGPTISRKHRIQCYTCSSGPINNISLDSHANEWASETLWVICSGSPKGWCKVRVDANPLLRLPGIYSKTQFRINGFTFTCVVICSYKAWMSLPCQNWVRNTTQTKGNRQSNKIFYLLPFRCRIISKDWIRFYIVGPIIQSSNM